MNGHNNDSMFRSSTPTGVASPEQWGTVDCTCIWTLCIAYCMASQSGKNYQFLQLQNTMGSKRQLNRPISWWSVKLFTTNQCYATTTHNTQCSNTTFKRKHSWL